VSGLYGVVNGWRTAEGLSVNRHQYERLVKARGGWRGSHSTAKCSKRQVKRVRPKGGRLEEDKRG
jgi:hypothetical protein